MNCTIVIQHVAKRMIQKQAFENSNSDYQELSIQVINELITALEELKREYPAWIGEYLPEARI